ncbi:hypothetical protein RDWZM_000242 [Blomia tropicalis]|uniref:Uncharacterized protein n=1 Tax=Blomia tropicalis TaxID=40697 RepID=A0A9Q0MBV1_BLOTA|nr:hypothetical protein RDWZM_000242 [Blomia tropicalis]
MVLPMPTHLQTRRGNRLSGKDGMCIVNDGKRERCHNLLIFHLQIQLFNVCECVLDSIGPLYAITFGVIDGRANAN